MNKEKILEILKSMPNFNDDLTDKYKHQINIAINVIDAKLKQNVEKNNDILSNLCAVLVNLWITMEVCSTSFSGSFAGNGYKIRKNVKKQYLMAKQLVDYWRALASDFLVDEGFSFFAIKEPSLK